MCGQTSSFTSKYCLSAVIVSDLDIVVVYVPIPGVKVGRKVEKYFIFVIRLLQSNSYLRHALKLFNMASGFLFKNVGTMWVHFSALK